MIGSVEALEAGLVRATGTRGHCDVMESCPLIRFQIHLWFFFLFRFPVGRGVGVGGGSGGGV